MKTTTELKIPDHVLLIEETNKGRLVKTSDILYLEANDNYCSLFLSSNEKIVVCRSLRSYQEELDPEVFFRCHKSYLVNIFYIKEYVNKRHEVTIVLHNNTNIQVARRRVCDLKRFLQVRLKTY